MGLRGPSSGKGRSLIACTGLPRSGSTLVFNLARELSAASGHEVKSLYAEDAPAVLAAAEALGAGGGALVVKCHSPSPALRSLMALTRSPRIVSIRDPRDCVYSLMAQFGRPFDRALDYVALSSIVLTAMGDAGALVLRYEDHDVHSSAWSGAIAHYLGLRLSWDDIDRVSDALDRDKVRHLIEGFVQDGVLDTDDPSVSSHPETLWHPHHVGDGQTGKFATGLTQDEAALVYLRTRAFCDLYGYPPSWPPAVDGRLSVLPGAGPSAYLREGFSWPEGWGAWTDGPRAVLFFPLARPCSSFRFAMTVSAGLVFAKTPKPRFTVTVNELPFPDLWEPEADEAMVLAVAGTMQTAESLRVEIAFDGLSPPSPDEQGSDTRTLGFAIRRLDLQVW